jgi:hypothetical protein
MRQKLIIAALLIALLLLALLGVVLRIGKNRGQA